jgi:hypothetical protein
MAQVNVLSNWKTIASFLPPEYEALAAEYAQVETKFGNAKIRDADTLLRFIFVHAGADLPLRQTVAVMAEAGEPSLSPMRLHKKMARAAPYLRSLVERMVGWGDEAAPEHWGGYVFCAVDATVVCGPGAVGTDARIHTKLRIADVSLSACEVTDEMGGETFSRFAWEAGELAVADRAYFTPRGIGHVLDDGADVLVRYRLDSVELQFCGVTLDVLSAVAHLDVGDMLDLDVEAKLPGRLAAGRLIAYRLPDEAVERVRGGQVRAAVHHRCARPTRHRAVPARVSAPLAGGAAVQAMEVALRLRPVAQLPRRYDPGLALRQAPSRCPARSDGLHPLRAFPPAARRAPRRRRDPCRATPGRRPASSGPSSSPHSCRSRCLKPSRACLTSFDDYVACNRLDDAHSANAFDVASSPRGTESGSTANANGGRGRARRRHLRRR